MSCEVLIIEDDADVAEALALVLEDAGFPTEIAPNGALGLERLKRGEPPRLILLDLMMPVMEGRQFRQEQLRRPELAKIPVVVLSADTHARRKAQEMGCSECLVKPINLDTLVDLVGRICERRG